MLLVVQTSFGQHSVARKWNEVLLESIRGDYARPTVHARNLFHISAAIYDAWAAYEPTANTYFLGKTNHGFTIPFEGVGGVQDKQAAQEMAISYAAYRLLKYRFANAPQSADLFILYDSLMNALGYDPGIKTLNYNNTPAGLGNYLAEFIINYGLQDGSNEQNGFRNRFYAPINEPLVLDIPGNSTISDPNRWQPLSFETFIDQSGNVVSGNTPEFLSPEWGEVMPFSLKEEELDLYERDGHEYWVYHDPGGPPLLDDTSTDQVGEYYKWGFSLVAIWSAHLDASDPTTVDISPGSLGNIDINSLPTSLADYDQFYDRLNGGDTGQGWSVNPVTNQPYEPQVVKRGDYARVLAEFWADGPDSETPPGHWFTLLNYVNDQPGLIKQIGGEGEVLDDLEWDVKSYFMLGGAMHDVAIASWAVKGYYDYVRPISAIRYMADKGQSSDPNLPSYNIEGIPLEPGFIELVEAGDPLAGTNNEDVGKIKLYAWRGHSEIVDTDVDVAGVGWILAEDWWPYQRPTFVTPPFAGFVSGHSTYSRAGAEVLTLLTGDPFFPGGMGEFHALKNEFLVFEEGPSEDLVLQWATYRDAADQCSLSRIWGGIHPPADDIPGRLMGETIGIEAFDFAMEYFNVPAAPLGERLLDNQVRVYPNPASEQLAVSLPVGIKAPIKIEVMDLMGRVLQTTYPERVGELQYLNISSLHQGVYFIKLSSQSTTTTRRFIKK